MPRCASCRLLQYAQDHRLYCDTDDFVVFEHLNTMTPILVSKHHGNTRIPPEAFLAVKLVANKLFGERFCLSVSPVDAEHFSIKVIKLLPFH